MKSKIRVLIVDDSKLICRLLTAILGHDDDLEVVGCAYNAFDAREKIKQLSPDVITLDVEMPKMDGITFLGNLMRLRPMPVVMISTLTKKGALTTLRALELGAVDFIAKPTVNVSENLSRLASDITNKVKCAAAANISAIEHNFHSRQLSKRVNTLPSSGPGSHINLIAIGASTGGTEAIKEVLLSLPAQMPPIVIVQHMPEGFTESFAQRLNTLTELTVTEFCENSQRLEANHVYIANGAYHMRVVRRGLGYSAVRDDSDPVNRHKPSVDTLFDSVTDACGENAAGILLTGMGVDGASGLGKMRNCGAITIAQDEESSVVWGMPRAAINQDAAVHVVPLSRIGNHLVNHCYEKARSLRN